jgi:hypothetical protein
VIKRIIYLKWSHFLVNNEKKRQKEEQILKELEERQRNSDKEKTEQQSTKLQLGNQSKTRRKLIIEYSQELGIH